MYFIVHNLRQEMLKSISKSCLGTGEQVIASTDNLYAMFLGKPDSPNSDEIYKEVRCVIARYVYQMYNMFIKHRAGIG